MIRLLYFANLREAVGRGEEAFSLKQPISVLELRSQLAARGNCWAQAFAPEEQLLSAVNQTLVPASAQVNDGDEVAFFPPVTGG